jgi:putative transposase
MDAFSILLTVAQALLKSRQRLLLENLALRQQAAVLRRGVKRPKLADQDRIFWITMVQLLDTCREALHIVQPDTVVRWHRRGWRCYWRRKSKVRKIGRPAIGWERVHLIKRLSRTQTPSADSPGRHSWPITWTRPSRATSSPCRR